MDSRTKISLRLGSLGALAIICVGCPNPNTYTTPRTVGSGRVSHSIAAESWGFSVPSSTAGGARTTGSIPTFPTYTLRLGIGDSVEIGGRIANMSSLGADVKWNFIRSGLFDVALDPAAQIFQIGTTDSTTNTSASISVIYLHAPLLLGLNLSRVVTLVLSPGITYGIVSAGVNSSSGQDSASATSGPLGRLGFGVDLRLSPGFALHPEITFLRNFDSNATTLYILGIGFNFGSLPNFDDVGGGASPAPAAAPPAYGAPPPPPGPPGYGAPPPPAAPPPV
jgi:hypothetical protein